MRIVFESVDPGSLEPVRDITPIIDSSEQASVSLDLDSDIGCSAQFGFVGNQAAIGNAVRISLVDDAGISETLITGFADVTESERMGKFETGSVELEGMLAALRDTCAPQAYVVPGGTSAASVINDICAQLGRPTAIPSDFGAGSYAQCIVYEAGTPWLTVAKEAAARCGMRLTQNRMGFVTLMPTGTAAEEEHWLLSPGSTEIITRIEKTTPAEPSPTRVVATWSSADKSLAASADAPVRGSHPRDVHLDVSDIEDPSTAVLAALAQQELDRQSQQESEWKFSVLYRSVDVGSIARITDLIDQSVMTGTITHIEFDMLPVLTMSVVVRGDVS